jgi:putative restriction endonuclease
MAIKLVVAVTDRDWFDHLRQRPDLAEVNFWAPSGTSFRVLEAGELFLFKLHAPANYIVGGGVFACASNLPCSLAWEAFGEANGATSLAAMRARIARYRRTGPEDRSDFAIGCRILTQPFFLAEHEWLPVPASWSPNIVSFKTYTSDEVDGQRLWEAVQDRLAPAVAAPPQSPQPRYGEPVLVRPRLGQGAFRVLVTDLYQRRCAVSGERTLPALDAAHIRPYGEGGEHAAQNGLLLRRDIHSLFDAGYVTVTPELRFEVSCRIREEFDNGRHYYALHGTPVAAPMRPDLAPDRSALRWHNEHRYRG